MQSRYGLNVLSRWKNRIELSRLSTSNPQHPSATRPPGTTTSPVLQSVHVESVCLRLLPVRLFSCSTYFILPCTKAAITVCLVFSARKYTSNTTRTFRYCTIFTGCAFHRELNGTRLVVLAFRCHGIAPSYPSSELRRTFGVVLVRRLR